MGSQVGGVYGLADQSSRTIRRRSGLLVRSRRPSARGVDLLFTDIVMPGGVNGKELAERARARHPHLKVLFTSGFAGAKLDVDDVLLSKPFRKSDLAKAVREILRVA